MSLGRDSKVEQVMLWKGGCSVSLRLLGVERFDSFVTYNWSLWQAVRDGWRV